MIIKPIAVGLLGLILLPGCGNSGASTATSEPSSEEAGMVEDITIRVDADAVAGTPSVGAGAAPRASSEPVPPASASHPVPVPKTEPVRSSEAPAMEGMEHPSGHDMGKSQN